MGEFEKYSKFVKKKVFYIFQTFSARVGIHEVERGEQEMQKEREQEAENQQDSDESESGSGLENRTLGFNTPPDSPNAIAQFIREHSLQYEGE